MADEVVLKPTALSVLAETTRKRTIGTAAFLAEVSRAAFASWHPATNGRRCASAHHVVHILLFLRIRIYNPASTQSSSESQRRCRVSSLLSFGSMCEYPRASATDSGDAPPPPTKNGDVAMPTSVDLREDSSPIRHVQKVGSSTEHGAQTLVGTSKLFAELSADSSRIV